MIVAIVDYGAGNLRSAEKALAEATAQESNGGSARVVVTMGMPALVYRYVFRAHSVKSLERNILGFVGIAPVHETLIGAVDNLDDTAKARWFQKLRDLGEAGA